MKKMPIVEDIIEQVRQALIKAGAMEEDTREITECLLMVSKWAFQHGIECGKLIRDSELKHDSMDFMRETIN